MVFKAESRVQYENSIIILLYIVKMYSNRPPTLNDECLNEHNMGPLKQMFFKGHFYVKIITH